MAPEFRLEVMRASLGFMGTVCVRELVCQIWRIVGRSGEVKEEEGVGGEVEWQGQVLP